MPKATKAVLNSKPLMRPVSEVVHSVGKAIERAPRETVVIQSFIERKMKGVVVPRGEKEQAALFARKYESILSAVKKSPECRKAAKKIFGEFEGGIGIRDDLTAKGPRSQELIIGVIIVIIVGIVLTGCVKDKPHQTTTTGGGVMQPGTSQNDPVNKGGGGTDGGTDGGD